MKTKKLEKQTLTWLVFSANVIIGAMARQMVLHHGLDAFNGYVAFGICILMLTVIYVNLQELFNKTLSPFFETLFMKFPNYGKKCKIKNRGSQRNDRRETFSQRNGHKSSTLHGLRTNPAIGYESQRTSRARKAHYSPDLHT